jgi:hypothetical protein
MQAMKVKRGNSNMMLGESEQYPYAQQLSAAKTVEKPNIRPGSRAKRI